MKLTRVSTHPVRSELTSTERKKLLHKRVGGELATAIGATLANVLGDTEGPDIELVTTLGRRTVEHTRYTTRDEFHDVEMKLAHAIRVAADALQVAGIGDFSVNYYWASEPRRKAKFKHVSFGRKVVPDAAAFAEETVRLLADLARCGSSQWFRAYTVPGREPWEPVVDGDSVMMAIDPRQFPEITRSCRRLLIHRNQIGGAQLLSESARMVGFDGDVLREIVENKMPTTRRASSQLADWLLVEFGLLPRSSQLPRFRLSEAVGVAREVHRKAGSPYEAIIFLHDLEFLQVDGSELLPNLRQHH